MDETTEEAYARGMKHGHADNDQQRKDMLEQVRLADERKREIHANFMAKVHEVASLTSERDAALETAEAAKLLHQQACADALQVADERDELRDQLANERSSRNADAIYAEELSNQIRAVSSERDELLEALKLAREYVPSNKVITGPIDAALAKHKQEKEI